MEDQKSYLPRPHIVRSQGILNAGGRALIKSYRMIPQGEKDFTKREVDIVSGLLRRELLSGKVNPHLGLGFSILSDGILNVSLWGGLFPSLLNQTVYSFSREALATSSFGFARQSLDETGTFCCWELGIAAHEGAAWRRYLLSAQSQEDRKVYLDNPFEGVVGL